MTDRPRERESVLQAALEATRAMTAAAKGVWRRVKASRALLSRARALGCTVGYGFGMAAAGFASGSCLPALSGKSLSGAPFAGHTPGRLPTSRVVREPRSRRAHAGPLPGRFSIRLARASFRVACAVSMGVYGGVLRWAVLEVRFDLRAEFGSNGRVFSRRRPAASLQSCCRSGRDVRMTVQAHADAVQLYKRAG